MDKFKAFAEKHGTLLAIIIGGVGIVVTIIVAGKISSGSSGSNTPSVLTDAAGNPITGGAQVSPTMSNGDLSAMLSDMEQQIINWEQNFNSNNPPPPPGTNPPPSPVPIGHNCPPGFHWVPLPIGILGNHDVGVCMPNFINPPGPPGPPIIVPPGNIIPGVKPPPIGNKIVPPIPPAAKFATAQKGNTVWGFWQNFGKSAGLSWSAYEKDFADWNGVKNINLIYAGKKYRVS